MYGKFDYCTLEFKPELVVNVFHWEKKKNGIES